MTGSMRRLPNLAGEKWLQEARLQKVLAVLNTGGVTRIAGGAVRNALMKMPISDVDLATTLLPTDVMQLAKGAGFAVHPTGLEHGTVTVVYRAAAFEVTTLRRDMQTDGRHAVVSFTTSFEEDASRRDFTMNALYCDANGKIYDFTNGYADIRRKRVKFVGVAARRIEEDYLRILRFFRFHAAYGKGMPDAKGVAACKKLRKGLAKISVERLRQELLKLLVAPRAVKTFQVMAKAQVLRQIIPHTEHWRVLNRLGPDAMLRLAVLAAEPLTLKDGLRLSKAEATRIEDALAAPEISPTLREKERRALLYRLGCQVWRDGVALSWARSRASDKDLKWKKLRKLPDRWVIPVLPLSGKELLAAGLIAGPEIGAGLQLAEDYWIASDFTAQADELLNLVKGEAAHGD